MLIKIILLNEERFIKDINHLQLLAVFNGYANLKSACEENINKNSKYERKISHETKINPFLF